MDDFDVFYELKVDIREALDWIYEDGELEAGLDRIKELVDY